jgi:hypothetical protein
MHSKAIIPSNSAISTISMPDSHVLPSLQAQAASTLDAAIGCQDENDAADQRQEIESLGKELSLVGIEPVLTHHSGLFQASNHS